VIRETCSVRVADAPIRDDNGDGVLHVMGDGIVVEFAGGHLRGAGPEVAPDAMTGIGIRITGKRVVLRGARVSGFKAAIVARGADGLVVEDCDVSGNYRQRLGSTPRREDSADWLRPHENDANEWLNRYGAGLWIEDTVGPVVRRVRARRGQNGIVLDRVTGARIYDNDCSFLSGWGLAMWRTRESVISRNAFDFCIRGYSHGVYNRGQDSAGILMFEQCSDNVIAENSITHGGDGIFAFAGREALGEVRPRDERDWYRRRGNNDNLIIDNDCSYAAAHGIELTFSFGNRIERNRLAGNAICGIWGGYSQDTVILGNMFEGNGERGYGLERGGVNIEHGMRNRIEGNLFHDDKCGVHLWWDADVGLMSTPWAAANDPGCDGNRIVGNVIGGTEAPKILLRDTKGTTHFRGNIGLDAADAIKTQGDSPIAFEVEPAPERVISATPNTSGEKRPVGARGSLAGREHIVMMEWGPYDYERPMLRLLGPTDDGHHELELLGASQPMSAYDWRCVPDGAITLVEGNRLIVRSVGGDVVPYRVTASVDNYFVSTRGVLANMKWRAVCFAYEVDPRENLQRWRTEAQAHPDGAPRWRTTMTGPLELRFGNGAPEDLSDPPELRNAGIGRDRFGTFAESSFVLPAGTWRIRTTSDDGIRVLLDGEPVIEDWTWHAPREHEHVFTQEKHGRRRIEVEHFELDGYAILVVEVVPVPVPAPD